MGESVAKYNGQLSSPKDSAYYYKISVPQPNGEFELYTVLATPQTGICTVTGLGKTHQNDGSGFATIAAFRRLKAALNERYGNSKDFDFLISGALWTKQNEWGWSIYKKERNLTSYWDSEERSNLPANVQSIVLDTKATGPNDTYITLRYEFANFGKCKAIVDRADSSGL